MLCIKTCETIFQLSYMFLMSFLPLPLLINIHIFEISEMTTHQRWHPLTAPTFKSALMFFSPGVSSRAELVTQYLKEELERVQRRCLRIIRLPHNYLHVNPWGEKKCGHVIIPPHYYGGSKPWFLPTMCGS